MTNHKTGAVVHGGAWDIPEHLQKPHRDGCIAALAIANRILDDGGIALDAVEAAVRYLEDDPTYDAGRGAFLNADGVPEHDAGMMCGATLDVGAAAGISGIRNPITLARAIFRSDHALLVGPGAVRFGLAHGVEAVDPAWHITAPMRDIWDASGGENLPAADFFAVPRGTVGAVARDRYGNLAAATSTGGTPGKPPGRVGDSPIPGAGYYADNELSAMSSTGWGEGFLRLAICYQGTQFSRDQSAPDACRSAITALDRLKGRGGVIMIDRLGTPGVSFNTSAMAYAYRDADNTIHAGP